MARLKTFGISLFVGVALSAGAAFAVFQSKTQFEHSPYSLGERLTYDAGCYACHGYSEFEGRVNFSESSSGRFRSTGLPTFWEDGIDSADVIKEWIRDGVPEKDREKHERLLVQMPAYGGTYLTEGQIDSIAAWVLGKGAALSGGNGTIDMSIPESLDPESLSRVELIVYGDRLSRQQACYQCHGEYGQGGVPNPASLKGYIPGFFGRDFRELTLNGRREEILHWIDTGRGKSVEEGLLGAVASRFFDGQAISMPGYRTLLTEKEKAVLVDYMLLLNEMGPLDAKAIETLNNQISDFVSDEDF